MGSPPTCQPIPGTGTTRGQDTRCKYAPGYKRASSDEVGVKLGAYCPWLVGWSRVADTSVRQVLRTVRANATGEAAARLRTREDPMSRLAVLPLLVSLSLLLTLPGSASAARAERFHDEETVLFC